MKIFCILLVSFLFTSCNDNPEYTRSQCITKTELFWDNNLTEKEQSKINNDFYSAKLLMWMNRSRLKLLIPAVRFPIFPIYSKKPPKFMYSEYSDKCNNKENMLLIFLEHIKFYVPDFPKYKITLDIVQPGVGTIL